MMRVSDLMRRNIATTGPDASLALAARRMRDQNVGCLPVLERERLIGMITHRDLVVRGVAEGLDPYRAIVREVMSTAAVAVFEDETVDAAHELMAAHLIKHLPVLDRRERLVGLLALRDISGTFAKCRPHQVTFYKQLASSSGHFRKVEVARGLPLACGREGGPGGGGDRPLRARARPRPLGPGGRPVRAREGRLSRCCRRHDGGSHGL
jgi:CBS domain-containing protein